jgi:hypothetical protein
MRRPSLAVVPLLLLPFATGVAQAQTTELALTCNGKSTYFSSTLDPTSMPVKNMSLVVNLTAKTVTGFSIAVNIISYDVAGVSFEGRGIDSGWTVTIHGAIDRTTGSVWAVESWKKGDELNDPRNWHGQALDLELICAPTKRVF